LRRHSGADKIDKNPKEEVALLTIVNTFTEISEFKLHLDIECRHDSDVEYLLKINGAGRKFITIGGGGGRERQPQFIPAVAT